MKLQLNERTLNAYINEAIRQEINEGVVDKVAGKLAGKSSQRTLGKMTRNGAKKFVGNLSGRRVKNAESLLDAAKKTADDATKAAQEAEKELKNLQKLKNQNLKQHRAWSAQQGPGRHYNQELGDAGEALDKQIKNATTKLNKANKAAQDAQKRVTTLTNNLGNKRVAQTATRWGTGAAAAGFGAGYLAGRSRKNGQNPDAPWNDGIADPGMDDGGFDDNGGNDGGFDGTFPWDNIDPAWTPRPTRNPQPQPGQAQVDPAQEEPAPVRPRMEPIGPVATPANMPTGVTSNQPESTIQRRYAPGTDPNNVNKWNNTANYRRLSGQIERGVSPEKANRTLQNRRERQEKRYDRISDRNSGQAQGSAQ